jgi:hypothetical protein
MLYDPADHYKPEETAAEFQKHSKQYERFMRLKQSRLIKFLKGKRNDKSKSLLSFFFNL